MIASEFTSSKRYGVDLGSGSAMAIFAYFNFGAGLRMVGIEANEMRYLYSVRLQELLSRSTDFRNQLSRMSLLFHGNAADILLERLSIHPLFLWVVYWFRQGWSYNDIQAVALYLNNVPNLEWIIVDLTFEDFKNFGYVGKLRSVGSEMSDVPVTSVTHSFMSYNSERQESAIEVSASLASEF